jgi:hypothetical protein
MSSVKITQVYPYITVKDLMEQLSTQSPEAKVRFQIAMNGDIGDCEHCSAKFLGSCRRCKKIYSKHILVKISPPKAKREKLSTLESKT